MVISVTKCAVVIATDFLCGMLLSDEVMTFSPENFAEELSKVLTVVIATVSRAGVAFISSSENFPSFVGAITPGDDVNSLASSVDL